jgi:hypothetical protein
MAATKEDASLMVQLLTMGGQMGLQDAMRNMMSEGFDPDKVSPNDPAVHTVLSFGEVLGTFVKQGLLDRGLVVDLLWVQGMWAKAGPAGLKAREASGEPRLYENFEALATG